MDFGGGEVGEVFLFEFGPEADGGTRGLTAGAAGAGWRRLWRCG